MSDAPENHTIRLMQEMREEMRTGFAEINTRIDGLTHILTMLAGHIHQHGQRIEQFEETNNQG